MDHTSLLALLKVLAAVGPTNLMLLIALPGGLALILSVVFLWLYMRRTDRLMLRSDQLAESYRSDMDAAMRQAASHQAELRQMYENNVELVRQAQRTADSLQTTIVTSTTTMAELATLVRTNQYCPKVRLEKDARGPQGG